jgi:hypothetical protein
MKKVYVAGAISSSNTEQSLKNIRKGIVMGAKLLKMGYSPYVPHLDYQFNLVQDESIDVKAYYQHDLEWLTVCDCMLVLEGWENSKGVKNEIRFAWNNKIPVYYSLDELVNKCTKI